MKCEDTERHRCAPRVRGASSRIARLACIPILAASAAASADTLRVDASAPGVTQNGQFWNTAFLDLQSAISAASEGDIIWVAEGTYVPSAAVDSGDARTKTFKLLRNMRIKGAFESGQTGDGSLTDRDIFSFTSTLSGDLGTQNDPVDNAYHVVLFEDTGETAGQFAQLNGFTVILGNADDPNEDANHEGGGVRVHRTGTGESPPAVEARVVNCTFTENVAQIGGAIAVIGDSFFYKPHLQVVNTAFSDNDAMHLGNELAQGGALSAHTANIEIWNCLFADNSSDFYAGALSISRGVLGTVTNCTIVDNHTAAGGIAGGIYVNAINTALYVQNSILWDNTDGQQDSDGEFAQITSSTGSTFPADISNTCIMNLSTITGTALIDDDPDFVDAANGDYRLDTGSPCVDAGDQDDVPPDSQDVNDNGDLDEPTPDLLLQTRIVPAAGASVRQVDMGAYEQPGEDCLAGDLNSDCQVDGADLGILLAAWGTSGPGDLNGDGVVDGADLGLLLGGWTGGQDYPRDCGCGESMMFAGGAAEASSAGWTSADLQEYLGFESPMALAEWLGQQPYSEMVEWLSLLDG